MKTLLIVLLFAAPALADSCYQYEYMSSAWVACSQAQYNERVNAQNAQHLQEIQNWGANAASNDSLTQQIQQGKDGGQDITAILQKLKEQHQRSQ